MATELQFIKSASYGYDDTGTSTFSITDCFNDTYEVFFVIVTMGQSGGAASDMNMRLLDSSDTEISTANYDYAGLVMNTGSVFSENRNTGQTSFIGIAGLTGRTSTNSSSSVNFYVYNPISSSYTFVQGQGMENTSRGNKYIGVLDLTTSCTGMKFIPNNVSATIRQITVSVYGVK